MKGIVKSVLEKALNNDLSSLSKKRIYRLLSKSLIEGLLFERINLSQLFDVVDREVQKKLAEVNDDESICAHDEWCSLMISYLPDLDSEDVEFLYLEFLRKENVVSSLLKKLVKKLCRIKGNKGLKRYLIDYSKLLFISICSFSYHCFIDEENSNNSSVIRICY
ncbi:hypothetical protein HMPREF9713_02989 [Myroides odoratimimus CCUG 12700]|uniref:hypothetical protein n=1 Tax=Myroides odoratimimus TaxID=76832 RepID=UPI0003532CA9|nr:hypothetical protein [Myroides odoratimimus]EPH08534.1 hypothetical protein HMPREF9713_02989 [Myroides odoratimimus CCUG 12700]MDM1452099.1 hypothetical protein [Myroides odoratimimus]MDM1475562.1 hypothetical protein [Myroides odoratimimus]MDM1488151.1 hypothetical protein [Myroides odoratimimus]